MLVRPLLRKPFEFVLFRADALELPDLTDLEIEMVGPGRSLTPVQKHFLRRHIKARRLWWQMRWHRRGEGWIFFAVCDQQLCHYTIVTPARQFQKMFPIIEPGTQMIGPCLTESAFRGRAIYPRLLSHVTRTVGELRRWPFYIYTHLANTGSIAGMEKAGFVRCGVWSGTQYLRGLITTSRRVAD